MTNPLSPDVARCPGRIHTHPYRHECTTCLRKTSLAYERQVWIAASLEYAPCCYRIETTLSSRDEVPKM